MRMSTNYLRAQQCTFIAAIILVSACNREPEQSSAENTVRDAADAVEAAGAESLSANGRDVIVPISPSGDITFRPMADRPQTGSTIKGMLRGGSAVPLNSADWPASFVMEFTTDDGSPSSCTAAMIGQGVMLTAAHCVPDTGKVGFAFNNISYELACVRHPKWETGEDPSADYGLCAVANPESPFVPTPGFKYETVDIGSMGRAMQVPVVLTGFGCTSDKVADQRRIDGRYRIGKNAIIATSETIAQRPYPANYFAPNGQRSNLITSENGANICPGDSGGPAFTAGTDGTGPRRIIGVNSRVFYARNDTSRFGASLISSTGSIDFGPWARKWLTNRGLAACGLAGAPQGCRP